MLLRNVVGFCLGSAVNLGQEVITCQAQKIHHNQDQEQDPANKICLL